LKAPDIVHIGANIAEPNLLAGVPVCLNHRHTFFFHEGDGWLLLIDCRNFRTHVIFLNKGPVSLSHRLSLIPYSRIKLSDSSLSEFWLTADCSDSDGALILVNINRIAAGQVLDRESNVKEVNV